VSVRAPTKQTTVTNLPLLCGPEQFILVSEWHQARNTMPTILEDKSRITTRVPAELRNTLEQAAQLQGATLNQFVVQSAFQEAQRVVERETVIRLSRRDAQKVFSLLDRSPKPNARLIEAVKAYRAKVRA